MTAFDRLHPALQHHIVNALGWRELRPFQEKVIPHLLDGKHMIVLAPTAGGKTECAVFPVLSKMLEENWQGLSVLYICPIKALLNNLEMRLGRYAELLGRRSGVWHGDVIDSDKAAIRREAPDILLTTPESLEAMLVSQRTDTAEMFGQLQVVIIDEVHAFAGDDRGWHLLSVLSRIEKIADREFQRIGLSATVGNPEDLLAWLTGPHVRPAQVHRPEACGVNEAEVTLDFVGSLDNAATVIGRLHRGEKRLVFVDSRSKAEKLTRALKSREVRTWVVHSSLSPDQRAQSERAFAEQSDCVIVATSALELGIDVGDLDRVIQIDTPSKVSSFLQRMGRTGRRAGTRANCLFLTLEHQTLVQADALLRLWEQGYVEPVVPPSFPVHVLAQQLMALALAGRGITRTDWPEWLAKVPALTEMNAAQQLIDYMLDQRIFYDDQGVLWFDVEGEKAFGKRHFMELLTMITSEPIYTVVHGRQEIGYVEAIALNFKPHEPHHLLLAGRTWRIGSIDWRRHIIRVEPAKVAAAIRWHGHGPTLSYALCQSIRETLAAKDNRAWWTSRTREAMTETRLDHQFLFSDSDSIQLVRSDRCYELWTFLGLGANLPLAHHLEQILGIKCEPDNLKVNIREIDALEGIVQAIKTVQAMSLDELRSLPSVVDDFEIKFHQAIPPALRQKMHSLRLTDPQALDAFRGAVFHTVVTESDH